MYLHVTSYNPETGIGRAIEASKYGVAPSGYHINIASFDKVLKVGQTYSFFPKHYWRDDLLIHAELDYANSEIS